MERFVVDGDGTLLDERERVLHFSESRFLRDVCEGSMCFVCGADPATTTFNDEHVFPQWILRRFSLHDRTIRLPNMTDIRYGQYKIQCCEPCNTFLGDAVEQPISQLFLSGADALATHLKNHGPLLLFSWLCLVFIKVHLKDGELRHYRDLRMGDSYIGDAYGWRGFHYIHTIARCAYSGAVMAPSALGSILVLPAIEHDGVETFDYADLYEASCMMVRIGDVAVVSVLTDSCAAATSLRPILERVKGPLSPLQVRELMVRAGDLNLRLKTRPTFKAGLNRRTGRVEIEADHPDTIEMSPPDRAMFGAMMDRNCATLYEMLARPGQDVAQVLERLRNGAITFLFDDTGNFIQEPFESS